jgi:hypothetical protein
MLSKEIVSGKGNADWEARPLLASRDPDIWLMYGDLVAWSDGARGTHAMRLNIDGSD